MRNFKYFLIIVVAIGLHSYLYYSNTIKHLDYKLYDLLNEFIPNKTIDDHNVVVIDIDNDSLRQFSQWSGIVNSQLINQVSLYHPSSIGVNIVFSQKDITSPLNIQHFYKEFLNFNMEMPTLPQALHDNDRMLIRSIKASQSTLSVYLSRDDNLLHNCYNLNNSNYFFDNIQVGLEAKSVLCNYKSLQKEVSLFGFSNLHVDSDGLFRRVPLFMNYNKQLFPSFSLATLLSVDKINFTEKVNYFSILGHTIHIDQDGYALLNFHTDLPRTISAIDVLRKKVGEDVFKGKIVLIGSSATMNNHRYLLSNDQKVSNTMIHATFIENVLNDALIVQPYYYKSINLALSICLSLLMIWFLFRRWYILMVLLFLTTMSVSTLVLIITYFDNVYISIGYLWIPFLDFFFIMSISFILLYVREKERSTQELLKSHSATLNSIILIASLHDDETGAHIQRTKNYVKALSEYFYNKKCYLNILTPEYMNCIYEAAPLHDIGKIGIPDAILKKPGRLTVEEFEIMKTHATLGKNVIQNTMKNYDKNNFLKVAYNIAYYHHEKWDGTGYPNGIKGNDIPLEAQFMTLADVYDALISKRRYKEAFSFEKAENIILEGKGTIYNPEIIEAFLELRSEFKKIALKWKDD